MAGHTEGEAPAAALCMRLTGGLKDLYDVCYSIQQNGTWSPWVRNDEGTAGQEGSGLKITGMRMTVITVWRQTVDVPPSLWWETG